MSDSNIINDRVNEAQALLGLRAKRLEKLLKTTQGKKTSDAFKEGTRILADMIKGQSDIIDTFVFDAPKSRLEQMRNLQLTTGGMNQTPTQFLKPATDAMDMMLDQLEKMVR